MQKIDEIILDARTLRDGKRIGELIDRANREVDQRVLSDAEIHKLELEHIFAKAWIVIGHESEIPNKGDFVTRHIGEDSVIVVRGKDGAIECLLNACSHRGTTVCRTEAGNAPMFRCIYHGWVFNHDGSLRGMPCKEEMFPNGCDTKSLGLRKARVEVFAGIIFANWDPESPTLTEFLGDFGWYLNALFNRTDYEVLGPPHRFVQRANWKTASEQFAGDGYHAFQLHRSLAELIPLKPNEPRQWSLYDPKVWTDEGHTAICFSMDERIRRAGGDTSTMTSLEKLEFLPPPGMTKAQVSDMAERFSEEELGLLSRNPPSQCAIFPNAAVWSNSTPMPDGRSFASFLSLRVYIPRGPDHFEFLMWTFVAKEAGEDFRDKLRAAASFGQGAVGFVECDDAEVWPGMTINARGFIGGQNVLRYWATSASGKPENWPAGGHVHSGFSADDTQWGWWCRYFDFLEGTAKGYSR